MVNKIPNCLDNPIDVQLFKNIDIILPILNKLNLTPNHITAVSLVFGIFASYFLSNVGHKYFFGIFMSAIDCDDFVDGGLMRDIELFT